jgi:hypothetical protein
MSTVLLTIVDRIVDICRQFCRHMSANKNDEASVKKVHMVGGNSRKRGDS